MQALWRIEALQQQLQAGHSRRHLRLTADGRFTNRTLLRRLPPQVTRIGRLRGDAKLYDVPACASCGARGGQAEGQTVVAPAMLFEELDLAKIDRDFDKPPILPTSLARD